MVVLRPGDVLMNCYVYGLPTGGFWFPALWGDGDGCDGYPNGF